MVVLPGPCATALSLDNIATSPRLTLSRKHCVKARRYQKASPVLPTATLRGPYTEVYILHPRTADPIRINRHRALPKDHRTAAVANGRFYFVSDSICSHRKLSNSRTLNTAVAGITQSNRRRTHMQFFHRTNPRELAKSELPGSSFGARYVIPKSRRQHGPRSVKVCTNGRLFSLRRDSAAGLVKATVAGTRRSASVRASAFAMESDSKR